MTTKDREPNDEIFYKLGKPYDTMSGILNRMFVVKDGVVQLFERSRRKSGRLLEEHYGAKLIDNPNAPAKKEEPKK